MELPTISRDNGFVGQDAPSARQSEPLSESADELPDREARGYDDLAMMMARDPGSLIFRRFTELNTKNLLFMQAELTLFEKDFEAFANSNSDEVFSYSVTAMKLAPSSVQWQTILQLRELLERYNTALLQFREVLRVDDLHPSDVDNWKRSLAKANAKLGFGISLQPEEQWKQSKHVLDRVALCSPLEGADPVTRFGYYSLGPLCYRLWGQRNTESPKYDPEHRAHWQYRNRHKIGLAAHVLFLIIASVVVISAMIGLTSIKGKWSRIGFAITLNILFVTLVGGMVHARRAETIAIATAFAAIQASLLVSSPTGQGNMGSPGHH